MDWEWISYYCENIFEERERLDGTILGNFVPVEPFPKGKVRTTEEDNGWGWYIFVE